VTKAFVNFSEYVWAKSAEKNSDISRDSTNVSNMVAGKWTHNWKMLEKPMLKGYLVFKLHKNKIPTAIPKLSG